jgi:hypothetical protein
MRWIRNFAVILILMWIVDACLKQPENSIIPQIQIQSVVFKKGNLTAFIDDTLIVTLKFSDGDGDLGVNGDETAIYTSQFDSTDINTPFYYIYDSAQNATWYYTHSSNVSLPKGYHYVNYAAHRNIHTHPFDTLSSTLTCKYWEIPSIAQIDTLYRQDNPYNSNFFMDIYTKNPNGSYTLFDLDSYYAINKCPVQVNRFPILSSDLGKKSSLDGTITYRYSSAVIYLLFHNEALKVKVYILDRAFHKSNVVESDDILIH